jgi:hypothetical protein
MLNQTRALWGIARESPIEGPGIIGTENGLGIVESADTIGPGDFELLTDARTAGLFRTASANPIEDIKSTRG